MTRSHFLLVGSAALLLACRHNSPEPTTTPAAQVATTSCFPESGRMAYQFNDEPPIISTPCAKTPIRYHGRQIAPEEIKEVSVLKAPEARARFNDQSLNGAILIKLQEVRYDPAVHR